MPFPAIEYCCALCERMSAADRLPEDGLCESCRGDEDRFERRRAAASRRAEQMDHLGLDDFYGAGRGE